jgi:phosphoribosyl 1,2-cyclic phosphate 1,2-diphosphodiesterase
MLGDLHIHTRFSDGSYEVREALAEASRRGLSYLSFVDHDTVEQTGAALAVAQAMVRDSAVSGAENPGSVGGVGFVGRPPLVIPGVEISAYDFDRDRKVHILGYGYDEEAASIRALCDPLIRRRHENTLKQIGALREAGYPVDEDAVRAVATGEEGAGKWLYKQHVMLVLIAAGRADAIYGLLYRSLFKGEGICAGDIEYVDARDAVRAVSEDGGLAVLAHPGQTDSWEMVPELVDAGLTGIELYHEDHGKADYRRSREASERHGLFLSGGADDHGAWGSEHRMGEIRAPFGTLEAMRSIGAARLPDGFLTD